MTASKLFRIDQNDSLTGLPTTFYVRGGGQTAKALARVLSLNAVPAMLSRVLRLNGGAVTTREARTVFIAAVRLLPGYAEVLDNQESLDSNFYAAVVDRMIEAWASNLTWEAPASAFVSRGLEDALPLIWGEDDDQEDGLYSDGQPVA